MGQASDRMRRMTQDRLRWRALVNLVGSTHGDGQEGPDPPSGHLGLSPGPPSRAWTRTTLHPAGGF